jgi:hypothetical protein
MSRLIEEFCPAFIVSSGADLIDVLRQHDDVDLLASRAHQDLPGVILPSGLVPVHLRQEFPMSSRDDVHQPVFSASPAPIALSVDVYPFVFILASIMALPPNCGIKCGMFEAAIG